MSHKIFLRENVTHVNVTLNLGLGPMATYVAHTATGQVLARYVHFIRSLRSLRSIHLFTRLTRSHGHKASGLGYTWPRAIGLCISVIHAFDGLKASRFMHYMHSIGLRPVDLMPVVVAWRVKRF